MFSSKLSIFFVPINRLEFELTRATKHHKFATFYITKHHKFATFYINKHYKFATVGFGRLA